MDIDALRALVQQELPDKYEPLLLSFRVADDHRYGRCIAIGDDYGTTLYCDPEDGHVISVDDQGRLPSRFVNSGITQLAQCVAEYEKLRKPREQAVSDEAHSELAQTLRLRLRGVDERALEQSEHWWSVILQQVDEGSL